MTLLKKHASLCALLAVLAAAVAAPYMIPANPDSAVFRSGTFSALLLLCGFFPVQQALERCSLRELFCGLGWGLLFSFALSLGSELLIYDGLLPGMGSMVRRLAAPVLAAPLLGGLCARLMHGASGLPQHHSLHIPFAAYMGIILLCWLPLLLAYFPGMLNYDVIGEYRQHIEGSYSSIHPLLHSALMNGVIALGSLIHSPTLGLLMMTLLQMGCFAAALSYTCVFVQRRGAPALALLLLTALFALHPVFSVMALSMTKDTLFAAAILVLSLETYALIEDPAAYFADRRRCALYALLCIPAALMRNNGIFALALLFPAMIVSLRGFRRKAVLLCTAGAGCAVIALGALNLALAPSSMPSFQFYSLPAQQLVRAYNSGKLSEDEKAEIARWYTSKEGLKVHPHLADPAKGYLDKDRLEAEGSEFLALWRKHAPSCAMEYTEAFLMLNVGSWYPDDLSHSTIYPDVSWNDKGYLQTQEYNMSEYDLHTRCFLPAVRSFYEQICRRNIYQKYPVVSILFCTATPLWALLFACAQLIARKRTRYLPAALGAMGLWLSYLFGPCTLPRYALPLFCLAPALMLLALYQKE